MRRPHPAIGAAALFILLCGEAPAAPAAPSIRAGKETTAYPSAVAIVLNGRIHCTGIILSTKTVLTAAHCITGYAREICAGQMSVTTSHKTYPEVAASSVTTLRVVGASYRDAGNTGKLIDCNAPPPPQAPSAPPANDIGVLQVAGELPGADGVRLHDPARVPWSSILAGSLVVVGYGFNTERCDSEGVRPGVKREGVIKIDRTDATRFYYNPICSAAATCRYDSGGPAYFLTPQQAVIVGVTSGATAAGCGAQNERFSTRVDAYRSWIVAQIRGCASAARTTDDPDC